MSFSLSDQLVMAYQQDASAHTMTVTATADGSTWSLTPVGTQQLGGSAAMTVFDDQLCLAYQANDGTNSVWFTASDNGTTWVFPGGDQPLAIPPAETVIAMAAFQGALWLAYVSGGALYLATSPDGKTWSANPIAGAPPVGACMAATVFNGQFCIAYQLNDGSNRVGFNTSLDGFGLPQRITTIPPAGSSMGLTVFNDTLYLAYQATGTTVAKGLWLATSSDGVHWSGNQVGSQSVGDCLAATVFNDLLCIAYQASDSTNDLWLTTSPDGVNWSAATVPNPQTSPSAPQQVGACLAMASLYVSS